MNTVAAVILNRNLPLLTDELAQWMRDQYKKTVDIYVVENGSDPRLYSKFANITFTESLGPARGINEALKVLRGKGYKYYWINFNDARYRTPNFLPVALELMERDNAIGIVTGFWPGNTRIYGNYAQAELISFFDPLGFVVSESALVVSAAYPRVHLDPLWDSTNYSNHYNVLATALALYSKRIGIATLRAHEIFELAEPASTNSEQARGISDTLWKEKIGPHDIRAWFQRVFPEYTGDVKHIREQVIVEIERLVHQAFPQVISPQSQNRGIAALKKLRSYVKF